MNSLYWGERRFLFHHYSAFMVRINFEIINTEIEINIAAEILFNGAISLHLVGQTEDGLPMVQAYYYDGDFVKQFNQDVIDTCLAEVPDHLLTPPSSVSPMSDTPSLTSEDGSFSTETSPEPSAAASPELPNCPAPALPRFHAAPPPRCTAPQPHRSQTSTPPNCTAFKHSTTALRILRA